MKLMKASTPNTSIAAAPRTNWGGPRPGAGRPRSADRCPCGTWTREQAAKRNHKCGPAHDLQEQLAATAAAIGRLEKTAGECPSQGPYAAALRSLQKVRRQLQAELATTAKRTASAPPTF